MRYKYILIAIFLLGFLYVANVSRVFAEDKVININKEITYDIYYEVGKFEVDCVENVKIQEIVTIGGIDFLVIKSSGIKNREGYILLASIKAILPSDSIEPLRTFGTKK